MRLWEKTPFAPQVPETLDPVTEALESAHAAAVAVEDWTRARTLASELEARHKAFKGRPKATTALPSPSPVRRKA